MTSSFIVPDDHPQLPLNPPPPDELLGALKVTGGMTWFNWPIDQYRPGLSKNGRRVLEDDPTAVAFFSEPPEIDDLVVPSPETKRRVNQTRARWIGIPACSVALLAAAAGVAAIFWPL